MADSKSSRTKFVVEHSNFLSPEDLYRFINLEGFDRDWQELGLGDDEQYLLQIQIMLAPFIPSVIEGTGGIRKTQFSPPPTENERRRTIEVLYAIFPDFSVAVMAAANWHDRMEELLPTDKSALRMILADMQTGLDHGE
jgi:hypothetical protein